MSYPPPGRLVEEDLPTAPISAENFWVLWNLQRAFAMKKPYEHQLYGPVNSFLVAIFVLRRLFSVNPQHVHRVVITAVEGHMHNLSIGSTGGIHQSRSEKQDTPQPTGKQYPDFTVVKVLPTPPRGAREVWLVCIVEIKLEDMDPEDKSAASHYSQMSRYMTRMQDLPNRDDVFYGFLISAAPSTYERWVVRADGYVQREEVDIPIFDGPAPLVQVLGQLARRFWNM